MLSRVMAGMYSRDAPLLGTDAIHPSIAAPLLFLIAEQNADAREAARPLVGGEANDLILTALIETILDIATERFKSILERAGRLQRLQLAVDRPAEVAIEQSLYGLCWSALVR